MSDSPNPDADTTPSSEYAVMVLLVDDQAMIGEAIRRALANQPNMDFHFCSSSTEAIKVAKQVHPTVILQDLVMPGLDGLTLVRQYRADPTTKDIPIIMLSTKEEPAVKSEAFAAGANDYIVKLPDTIELVARIRYHSKAYLNQIQRDAAYRALRESQRQLMEKNLELQRLSNVDGLTGLSNRRYFNEYLEDEWIRATRDREPISALIIDVDDFKRYNDTYGHLPGDKVLRNVAETLQQCSRRPADLTARFGGEEFVVLLPATDLSGARYLAERLCRSVEELQIPHSDSSVSRFVTISAGVASMIPRHGESPLLLIEAADKALYAAKRTGKNRAISYE